MSKKMVTLRKISTGGILIAPGSSATQVINRMHLDPMDWEEVKSGKESEVIPDGESQEDARPEGN